MLTLKIGPSKRKSRSNSLTPTPSSSERTLPVKKWWWKQRKKSLSEPRKLIKTSERRSMSRKIRSKLVKRSSDRKNKSSMRKVRKLMISRLQSPTK